jgi:hypothetical protein
VVLTCGNRCFHNLIFSWEVYKNKLLSLLHVVRNKYDIHVKKEITMVDDRKSFQELLAEEVPEPVVPVRAVASLALTQVRDIGLALARMAEEQMSVAERVDTLTVRVDDAHVRLDRAVEVVKGFHRRLTSVECRVLPHECISSEQATEVRLAVQRLAELLTGKAAGSRGPSGKVPNFYSGIFTEIYNRTGAPRYELIRVEDYAGVMRFLEDWWKSASRRGEKRKEAESPI